jgi:hypothetical protein
MRKTGKVMPHRNILIFLLFGMSCMVFGQTKVTASLDAKQVLVQESFTWKLEVVGSDGMPNVRLGDIDKIALLSGPMQSSNYTFVNGKTSSKKTISYTFVALETGKVVFPPVDVIIGKKVFKTHCCITTI